MFASPKVISSAGSDVMFASPKIISSAIHNRNFLHFETSFSIISVIK